MNRIVIFATAACIVVVTAYGPPPPQQPGNQITSSGSVHSSGCGPGGCRNAVSSTGCGPGGCPSSGGCGPGGCPGGAKKDYWWEGPTNPFKGCIQGTPGCKIVSSQPSRGSQGRPGSIQQVHSISLPSSSGCAPGTPGCPGSYPEIQTGPGTITTNIHTISAPGQSGCAPGQFGCAPDPAPVNNRPSGHSDTGPKITNIHSSSPSQPGCRPGQFGCAPETVPISSQPGCAPGQFGCAPDQFPISTGPIGNIDSGRVTTNIHSGSQQQPGCAPGQFGCAPPVQHSPSRPSDCRPGTVNCGPYEEDTGTDIVIDIVETPLHPTIDFPTHSVGSSSSFPKPSGNFSPGPSSGSVHSVPGRGSNNYPDPQSSGSIVSHSQSFPSVNQHRETSQNGQYQPNQQPGQSGQYKPSQDPGQNGQYQPSQQPGQNGQYQPHQQPGFSSSGSGSFQSNVPVPGVPFRQGDINPQDLRPISTGVSLNGVNMMMMPMAMALPGGTCSAGSFCVQANTCNPYTGFIIRNINQIAAVRKGQPQVPLLECFVPARVLSDGVCCQESHPIAGTGLD